MAEHVASYISQLERRNMHVESHDGLVPVPIEVSHSSMVEGSVAICWIQQTFSSAPCSCNVSNRFWLIRSLSNEPMKDSDDLEEFSPICGNFCSSSS